jgi:hypothetical protein
MVEGGMGMYLYEGSTCRMGQDLGSNGSIRKNMQFVS